MGSRAWVLAARQYSLSHCGLEFPLVAAQSWAPQDEKFYFSHVADQSAAEQSWRVLSADGEATLKCRTGEGKVYEE